MVNANWDQVWTELGKGMSKNPARKMRFIAIQKLVDDGSILDFGAGDGELVHYLSKSHKDVKGVELSAGGVDSSRRYSATGDTNVITQINSVDDLQGIYDNIILSEVIEHIEKPSEVLLKLKKHLSRNGKFIVTVPSGPMSFFDKFIGHHMHYSHKKICDLANAVEMEVTFYSKIGFPLINIVRLWAIFRRKRILLDLRNTKTVNAANVVSTFLFNALIRISLKKNSLGWQIVATLKPKTSTKKF